MRDNARSCETSFAFPELAEIADIQVSVYPNISVENECSHPHP